MNLTTCTLAAVMTALSMVPAWAAVIEADSASQSSNYNAVISATDLINAGQVSLSSATQVSGNFNDTNGLAGTHDGFGQDGTQTNTAFTYSPPSFGAVTLMYALQTTASSGGSASGYTITAVDVVAGWPGAGCYARQSWSVAVATVANPAVFTPLAAVEYDPYPLIDNNYYTGYTHVRLTDSSGALASGVVAVQVILNGVPAIISEIDVAGLATPVPEPAAITLLLAGLLGVGMRNRRPAKP